MPIKPLQYAIYKGVGGKWGAAQFNLQLPHYYNGKQKSFDGTTPDGGLVFAPGGGLLDGWNIREGCVFMEITSTTAPNVYDWEKKIVMALSPNDMAQLLFGLRTGNEVKLMHDPNAKREGQGTVQKGLNFSSPRGTAEGGMLTVTHTEGGETRKHTVPLNGPEVLALATLLAAALPLALGW